VVNDQPPPTGCCALVVEHHVDVLVLVEPAW
jgi:hypothetical protein